MIQLRKNPFSETSITVPFVENEKASELLKRTLEANGYEITDNLTKNFHIVINGLSVEKDLWDYIVIKESDTVLMCPVIARGDGAQMFKIIAIIAVTVAIAVINPYAAGTFAAAAFSAAATVGATLLLNALIPPPGLPGVGGLGGAGASFDGSQMYTITGQANNAKKFGYVPKVYGSHRIFPLIAANPYTEIEADPATGTLVQFYYCIYDFGFGPLEISDLKIGDTNLTDYGDAHYRLVDLNKPSVSEGEWDDVLYDSFAFYKGDVERDGTSVAIDKNQADPGASVSPVTREGDLFEGSNIITNVTIDTGDLGINTIITGAGIPTNSYITALTSDTITISEPVTATATGVDLLFTAVGDFQVIRNASSKVNGNDQEITLDFVFPQGLIAYGTNGNAVNRSVDLDIEFSKIDEEVWRPFNDTTYVSDYSHTGGGSTDRTATVAPLTLGYTPDNYTRLSTTTYNPYSYGGRSTYSILNHGYPKGTTYITLKTGEAVVGEVLYLSGNILGTVASISSSPLGGTYKQYNLAAPLPASVTVYQVKMENVSVNGVPSKKFTYVGDKANLTTNKVYVKYKLGGVTLTGKTTAPLYATVKFKPIEVSQYKIRITRKVSYSTATYRTFDKMSLVNLSTRFDRTPIITDKRHVFLEVRIRATNQLNGSISNLSAVADSVLDVWDGSAWVKQKTNNPAWVYCDLLTGIVNKKPLSKDRLHIDSIVEWAEFCEEIPATPPSFEEDYQMPRFTCNFVLDFDTTLQSIVSSVTNAAQASLNVIDGKYGVLVDKLKTVPVQIFTPRNSWGFSSTRNYAETPHALKIRYIDPSLNWEVTEATVYDPDYDEETATEIDELSSFACTSNEQAIRFGRYMMAQSKLRRENITISVDFEHLVCTRGDFVQITQDVMRVGGRPARVKSVNGSIIKIDDAIDTLPVDYGYVYRGVDGIQTSTLTVIDSDEFELDGEVPEVGDLIVIGEVGQIVMDCLVKAISPNSDLSATLHLVEKADEIYDAESSDVPPVYNPQINSNVDSVLATPPALEDLVVTANTWKVVGAAYEYYIDLDWELPTGSAYETFEVYVDSGAGYNLHDFTQESFYHYIVDPANLGVTHNFKILAVSSSGKKLNLIEAATVSATPLSKTTPPSTVDALYINITGEVLTLEWPAVTDSDLKEYLIRYSPNVETGSWETSIPLMRVDKNTTTTSTQGRTGKYLIRAVDLNLNESDDSAVAITSIPNLFDLNVIDQTNDFPDLEGELDTVESDGSSLMLKKLVDGGVETNLYYPEGYYYYKDFLDLGDIYTVRLQSLIEAEGFTVEDIMENWVTLDDVDTLTHAGNSDWDVETQYRTTASFNVMSEWTLLSDIDPLSEGTQDNWGEWKKFTIGDATGRVFQFRLKLISNKADVTPRVYDGVIKSDMPDRSEIYNNIIATPSGYDIVYTPAFKGPGTSPNIQITQDNAEAGDHFEIENKTLNGFKITFYDINNVAVTRQFDAAIRGFGRKSTAAI